MNKIKDFFLRFNSEYFFTVPAESKIIYFFLGLFLVLLIVTFVAARFISQKNEIYKRFSKTFFWTNFVLSFTGLFLVFNRYEKVTIFSWRIWVYLVIAIIALINLYFYYISSKRLEADTLKLLSKKRKEKWLNSPKKKKK